MTKIGSLISLSLKLYFSIYSLSQCHQYHADFPVRTQNEPDFSHSLIYLFNCLKTSHLILFIPVSTANSDLNLVHYYFFHELWK